MNTLQQYIKTLLTNSPSGVHGIIYGPKKKNGNLTNQDSLIYFVEKKLPVSEIPENEIIPKNINISNKQYVTDVVQMKQFVLNQCYDLSDQAVVYLQTKQRPLSGGLEISNLAGWKDTGSGFTISYGTLGFFAVDNTDGTLVGVTNNHVIVNDAFVNTEKNPLSALSTIFDKITILSSQRNPSVLQFGSAIGNVNLNTDSIGVPKRYVPISQYQYNTVDAALIAINPSTVNSSSASQAELLNSFAMPFATTNEVTSLSSNSTTIYNVGRTTGPKGTNCPLVVYGSGSVNVRFIRQNASTLITMSDVFVYHFTDLSNLPIYGGDSGSAIIGNFGGTYKIVGLAFAGDTNEDIYNPTSTYGVACRIDNIAQQLNISAWNGNSTNFNDLNTDNLLKIYRPLNDTRTNIQYNGKTYYQAGILKTNSPDTNI
jgi:hypothetical protein